MPKTDCLRESTRIESRLCNFPGIVIRSIISTLSWPRDAEYKHQERTCDIRPGFRRLACCYHESGKAFC
jgi:hypothetical protein